MEVKNNYNECLTNLACSIRKYFNLEYKHNTLSYIDELLESYKPKNVVCILCDGMGSYIMDNILPSDSFLTRNRIKSITTVFPATTVAATTSMRVGLNPYETCMLGWDTYIKDIDKVVTTFFGYEKGDDEEKVIDEAVSYLKKHTITKSIVEEINERNEFSAYELLPFGEEPYSDVDNMYEIIKSKCMEDGKKYIYAYNIEPDHSMHELGTHSFKVQNLVKEINSKIEKLSNELEDTIIFVVADHGHKNIININLEDYPDIVDCLKRNTSIEPRSVNFFIKDDKKEEFVLLFNKFFGDSFNLYTKEEVINSQIFGDGEENSEFRSMLGDFLAIAYSDKTLLYSGNMALKSHHAGYTDEEIYIPLIVINKCK